MKLFSESWHRVAGYTIRLRPEVEAHKQRFRGENWYVLRDPYANQYFRLRAGAYHFVSRLRDGVSVEEVWKECLELDPEQAPGQDEVISLVGQLYQNNLISSNLPPDSEKLFDRIKKRKQKEWEGRLKSFLTPRFTLFNPDPFLVRCLPFLRPLLGWLGVGLWLVVVLLGLKTALAHIPELRSQTAGALAPDNWLALFGVSVLARTIHEFGHGILCRSRGGQVPKCGLILLVFTLVPVPMPYMDVTSSYSFRSKRDRILVAAGGMLFEFFFAALICLLWAQTGDGMARHVMYNFMFITSVTTLLLNINPLLKYDGYYIFSELMDLPNLQDRSLKQLTYLVERYAFRLPNSVPVAATASESWMLAGYGVASFIYKIFLIYLIIQLVAGSFLGIGYFIALVLLVVWVLVPIGNGVEYLINSPRLFRNRARAWAVTGIVVAAILCLTMAVPLPCGFRAPGVVMARDRTEVYTGVDGFIVELVTPVGTEVKKGDTLLRMANGEVPEEILAQEMALKRLNLQRDLVEKTNLSQLPVVSRQIQAAQERLGYLQEKAQALEVVAPGDGIWLMQNPDETTGRLLVKGMVLGEIIKPGHSIFKAVVNQEDASHLFAGQIRVAASEVRLKGAAGRALPVKQLGLIPAEQESLPSPALGWNGGGDIEVDPHDPSGTKATRAFYLVNADLKDSSDPSLKHLRTGYICVALPPEPVFWQSLRWFRQMLQAKHKI